MAALRVNVPELPICSRHFSSPADYGTSPSQHQKGVDIGSKPRPRPTLCLLPYHDLPRLLPAFHIDLFLLFMRALFVISYIVQTLIKNFPLFLMAHVHQKPLICLFPPSDYLTRITCHACTLQSCVLDSGPPNAALSPCQRCCHLVLMRSYFWYLKR